MVIDWNRIDKIAREAAGWMGQTILRREPHYSLNVMNFYFASGWYAEVDGEWFCVHDDDDDVTLRSAFVSAFCEQYERHGKPVAPEPDPVLGHIIEAIDSHCKNGATRRDLAIFVGQKALASIQRAWSSKVITAPLCPHGGSAAQHHPRQVGLVGDAIFEQSYRGEIMGVPILFDHCCPVDYWTVQRAPAEATEPKTICPLCGKESDQAPMSLYGMKVVGCSCVESFAGGRYDGIMLDKEQWQKAIDDAFRDCAEAIRSDVMIDDWNAPTAIAYDGLPLATCVHRLELRARPDYESRIDPILPEPFTSLTPLQEEAARAEWSRRLRELQGEARRKEREQVVIDIDWE